MKKWFCLLMAALLCFSVLPAGALAEDGGELSLVPGGLVMQEETELPETPAETEAPEETEEPEATEAPEESEAPEVTEAPEETEAPEVTEAPEEPEEPEATEVPQETEEPEATESPEDTEETQLEEEENAGEESAPEEIITEADDLEAALDGSYSTAYPNTWTNTGKQAVDIAEIAYTQVGYTETSNHTKYNYWYYCEDKAADWCAIFVSWCAKEAGVLASGGMRKSAVAGPNSFGISYSEYSKVTPRKGDLAFFNNFAHVGIVYKVTDDYVYVVEGNTSSGKVSYNSYSRSGTGSWRITHIGRPAYVNSTVTPTVDVWTSDTRYGDETTSFCVDQGVYLCYRIYSDSSRQTLLDEVANLTYNVKMTVYDPSGDAVRTLNLDDDESRLWRKFTTPGTYTYKIVVTGGITKTISGSFKVIAPPAAPTVSVNKTAYTVGETVTVTRSSPANATEVAMGLYRGDSLSTRTELVYSTHNSSGTWTADAPGNYFAVAVAGNDAGANMSEIVQFTVYAPAGAPDIKTDSTLYSVGDTVTFSMTYVEGMTYTLPLVERYDDASNTWLALTSESDTTNRDLNLLLNMNRLRLGAMSSVQWEPTTAGQYRVSATCINEAGQSAFSGYYNFYVSFVNIDSAQQDTIVGITVEHKVQGGDTEDDSDTSLDGEDSFIQGDILYGDANGDGTVDGRDVIRLRKYLANYDGEADEQSVAIAEGADANGDGVIDGRDVIRLRKYLANYDSETGRSTVTLGPSE